MGKEKPISNNKWYSSGIQGARGAESRSSLDSRDCLREIKMEGSVKFSEENLE